MRTFLCVTFALGAWGLDEQASATPMQKIISMLEGMLAKSESGKEMATQVHEEYLEWERKSLSTLHYQIENLNEDITKQTAIVSKETATSDEQANLLRVTNAAISDLVNEMAANQRQAEADAEEYMRLAADLADQIDAIERAITVMKNAHHDRPQADTLLQVSGIVQRLPSSLDKTSLMNYLAGKVEPVAETSKASLLSSSTEDESTPNGAPAPDAYEATGGRIIELLTELLAKAKAQKHELDMGNENTQHAFALGRQHQSSELASLKATAERATIAKSEADRTAAAADTTLDADLVQLSEAKTTQKETIATGKVKKAEYAADDKLRAEEIQALKTAIDIFKNEVQGHADKHLPGFFLFAQLRSVSSGQMISAPMKQELFGFIQGRAARLDSQALALLAANLSGPAADPFVKIRGMIEALIKKLEDEAKKEAEEHSWCAGELSANEAKRKKLRATVEKLNGDVDMTSAKIQEISEKMAVESDIMAEETKSQAEATAIRVKEKKTNEETIADAKAAQQAIDKALTVLKEFYGRAQEQMATTSQTQAGQQESAGGVVHMIEVLDSDFARLQADTEAAESAAASEYDRFMADSKATHKSNYDSNFQNKMTKDQEQHKLKNFKEDLADNEDQLKAAKEYQQGLNEQCVETKLSYEERVQLRKEEIASLEEAISMLEGTA